MRDVPDDGPRGGGEILSELFYRLQLPRGVVLMPDVQYIHDPGADATISDAWVLTLRFEVDF